MTALSPQLLITAAHALVAAPEIGPALRGNLSERWLPRLGGIAGVDDWDMAFVQGIGHTAHYNLRAGTSIWPLPATHDRNAIAEYARTHHAMTEVPQVGDIFLLWSPVRRAFCRSGIVAEIAGAVEYSTGAQVFDCVTIEGNTDRDFGRGQEVLCHTRRLAPAKGDRFVHWVALDHRDAIGQPTFGARKAA
jgi:hypothetical protein